MYFSFFLGDERTQNFKKKFTTANYIHPSTLNKWKKNIGSDEMDAKDMLIMNRSIAEIDSFTNRSIAEYDRLADEVRAKRHKLNEWITENEATAKGEVIAMFHKSDIDLLNAQMSIINAKIKAQMDKTKTIRDERKYYSDKNKSKQSDTQIQEAQVVNQPQRADSPLAMISGNTGPTGGNANIYVNSVVQHKVDSSTLPVISADQPNITTVEPLQVEDKPKFIIPPVKDTYPEAIPSPTEQGVDIKNYSTPIQETDVSIHKGVGIPLSHDMNGNVNNTTSSVINGKSALLMQRIAEANEDPDYRTGIGVSYNQTLQKIRQDQSNVKPHLYVDTTSGKYYLKGMEVDNNGDIIKEYKNYLPLGLDVLGKLRFNAYKPIATPEFYPEPIDLHIVHNLDGMPDFYKKEWESPNSGSFIIDNDADLSVLEKFSK